jgi:hypothetical protein
VVAGDNVTVAGTGSQALPYVISADDPAGSTVVHVADTATLDMHISGTGTSGDPYIVSGDVLASAPAIYLEAIVKSGAASVAANLMPPGFRVPAACTLNAVYVNVGTAPTGSALTVLIKRSGTTLATVTVSAGATSGSSTGLTTSLASGDLLTTDISAIGSAIPGSDVLVTISAA